MQRSPEIGLRRILDQDVGDVGRGARCGADGCHQPGVGSCAADAARQRWAVAELRGGQAGRH